jgi:hypothetical protein
MPASVNVSYLGDETKEAQFKTELKKIFNEHSSDWTVNLTGGQHTTEWALRVTAPNDRSEWVMKMDGADGHKTENVLREARRMAEAMLKTS